MMIRYGKSARGKDTPLNVAPGLILPVRLAVQERPSFPGCGSEKQNLSLQPTLSYSSDSGQSGEAMDHKVAFPADESCAFTPAVTALQMHTYYWYILERDVRNFLKTCRFRHSEVVGISKIVRWQVALRS